MSHAEVSPGGGTQHYPIVIVGGGTGGISVAARLTRKVPAAHMAIIEPSEHHYYQPLWTLVGGGEATKEETVRNEGDLIPSGVTWIRERVTQFDPDHNRVTTSSGRQLSYDYLVVATGIQIDWHKVEGLAGQVGKGGIVSNYSYDTVDSTWEALQGLKSGQALFTHPATPIKCGGAPQKIMFLADDWLRKSGVRDQVKIDFFIAEPTIFKAQKYADVLTRLIAEKGINVHFRHHLVAVKPTEHLAIFENLDTKERKEVGYQFLHVTPPMSAPDVLKASPLGNAGGWVDVDKHSLRHVKFPNVFALGDCSSLPTSKTGAAIRKQAPVLAENLLAALNGRPLPASYDGYTSCPLVTGYGKLVLAEFDYDLQPRESFPFDQGEERLSMYWLKKYGLPPLYWHGMMNGWA